MSHHQDRDGAIEEIHLPGPTLVPMFTAAGIALALIGLILSWPIVVAGAVIALIAIVKWIRDVHEDIEQLPTGSERR